MRPSEKSMAALSAFTVCSGLLHIDGISVLKLFRLREPHSIASIKRIYRTKNAELMSQSWIRRFLSRKQPSDSKIRRPYDKRPLFSDGLKMRLQGCFHRRTHFFPAPVAVDDAVTLRMGGGTVEISTAHAGEKLRLFLFEAVFLA